MVAVQFPLGDWRVPPALSKHLRTMESSGSPGQLDVFVNDEFLIGKNEKASLWEYLFGNGGYPTPEMVVQLREKRLRSS